MGSDLMLTTLVLSRDCQSGQPRKAYKVFCPLNGDHSSVRACYLGSVKHRNAAVNAYMQLEAPVWFICF